MSSTSELTRPSQYLQMALDLEERILAGHLKSGERLPSYSQMRAQYGASQVTLERVYAVLDKKGLIRREAKRGIFVAEPKPKGKPVIEVVTRIELQFHEYYVRLLQGIQEEAYRRGAEIVLCREDDMLEAHRVDGIVLTSAYQEVRQMIQADYPSTPCVMIGSQYPPGLASIDVDGPAGIKAAVQHLTALGHERIGYLSIEVVRNEYSPPPVRLPAYREALKAAGIEPDPRLEWPLRTSALEPWRDWVELGRDRMALWLENGWAELGCTALLAQNDEVAIGMMETLEHAGIRVPLDVSLVGFDGLLLGSRFRPQLTTVKVPLVEVGSAAVASLMQFLDQKNENVGRQKPRARPTSVVIAPEFIEYSTTTLAPHLRGN